MMNRQFSILVIGNIEKIFADGGDTEEYWENGVPVRIETNLAVRRTKDKQ